MIVKEIKQNDRRTPDLVLWDFKLSIYRKILISNGNISIKRGDKIGLIGRNGIGKSVLLETINSVANNSKLPEAIEFNRKMIEISPDIKIGYIPQDIQLKFSGTVKEYLDLQAKEISDTVTEYEKYDQKLVDKKTSEYRELLNKMNLMNGWTYNDKRKSVLEGLGIDEKYLFKEIGEISGGEATKISLAGLMLSNSNFYILDEPTNNLDIKSLVFFENFINKFTGSVIIASHDRMFLENVNRIIEINEEDNNLNIYGGNYSFYHRQKIKEFESKEKAYEEQQKKKKKLEESIKSLKIMANSFENESHNAFYKTKGAKVAKRAKIQERRLHNELEKISEPKKPEKPSFSVPDVDNSRFLIASLKNINFYYDPDIPLLNNINFDIYNNEKLAVIGLNGSGKSTLIKIILGKLKPKSGNIELKEKIAIGYLPQSPNKENLSKTVMEYGRDEFFLSINEVKKVLGKLLLDDVLSERMDSLSVGEMRKIELGFLFLKNTDFLILDEPTNHMDLYTIEMLEYMLLKYRGPLIIVSHDRYLLSKININRIITFQNGKLVLTDIKNSSDIEIAFNNI